MQRRAFLQSSLAAASAPAATPKRPNILYVFSDQQRATAMGAYGNPQVRTPTLDKFAQQGARFDIAISNTPVCCPHRASLQTGLLSHHHGVVSNGVHFSRPTRGLAEQFRAAGYTTGYAGKWHIPQGYGSENSHPLGFPASAPGGLTRGGEDGARGHCIMRDGKQLYIPSVLADQTIQFIQQQSAAAAPWVFFLSWLPPHTPYVAPPDFRRNYEGKLDLPPNVPKGLPAEFTRKVLPDYYGMVESLDFEFQRILAALDRAGVAEDTIVCYSSDHGDMLGGHGYTYKRWPHDDSARVPLLIRYPRKIRPGTVISDPFSTIDVYPTLASLAGLAPPSSLDGLDFAPLLTGTARTAPRDHAYLQMLYAYVPWPGWRAIRTRDYTYARTASGPWLLYHTAKDPYQLKNLADDPSSRTLLGEMDRRLTALMKQHNDTWDYRATTGDFQSWIPGGAKSDHQVLGTPYPGSDDSGAAQKGKRKKKR